MGKRGSDFLEGKAIPSPEFIVCAVSTWCELGGSHLYIAVLTPGCKWDRLGGLGDVRRVRRRES